MIKIIREDYFYGNKILNTFVSVYKNPTLKEIRECGLHPRLLITNDNNIYISDNSNIICHNKIVKELIDNNLLDKKYSEYGVLKNPELGIILQLDSTNKVFYLSESYSKNIIENYKDFFIELLNNILNRYKPYYDWKLIKFNLKDMNNDKNN